MASKKRPRTETTDDTRAECPFTIRLVDPKEKEQKSKKRRKSAAPEEDDGSKKALNQLSPFSPSGKFKSFETMDVHYVVEPAKKWSEMTRYNSFVLNGVKYFSEGFIFVANESSIERQKALANKEPLQPRKKSDDDWVARILEIRASDEHHVYARVYWMYWPDELPPHTIDGKKTVQGRQPYHGQMELIASNHMDIINVVSVTTQAQVNQMIEDNDDDVQSSLYWRQAFDVRTNELSSVVRHLMLTKNSDTQSVEAVCKCGKPGNPDKTLIGCTDEACHKWLHSDCLRHDALLKTYERLGKTKPHVVLELVKEERDKDGEEAKRPLSPKETGAAVSVQQSIDAKAGGEPASVKNGDVKDIKMDGEKAASSSEEPSARTDAENSANSTEITARSGLGRKQGKLKRKPEATLDSKPYEGLFEATIQMEETPPMIEIRDHREGIEGGEKTWLEPMACLVCGSQIV